RDDHELALNLLPYPRSLKRRTGFYNLPDRSVLRLAPELPRESTLLPVAERLNAAAKAVGVNLELVTGPASHPRLAIAAVQNPAASSDPEGYSLSIGSQGIAIEYREQGGLRAAVATLRQLIREFGRRLPHLAIRDYPDFPRRGVMLDISRG